MLIIPYLLPRCASKSCNSLIHVSLDEVSGLRARRKELSGRQFLIDNALSHFDVFVCFGTVFQTNLDVWLVLLRLTAQCARAQNGSRITPMRRILSFYGFFLFLDLLVLGFVLDFICACTARIAHYIRNLYIVHRVKKSVKIKAPYRRIEIQK